MKAFWASVSFSPARLAAYWMLKTTKAARTSQAKEITATTQPTTSLWLAAKITATRKAMSTTVMPSAPIRKPLKGLLAEADEGTDDGESPRDRMHPLSQTPHGEPLASTPGEQPAPLFQEELAQPSGRERDAESDHHKVVGHMYCRGRAERANADLPEEFHAVPERHRLDEPLDVLRIDA